MDMGRIGKCYVTKCCNILPNSVLPFAEKQHLQAKPRYSQLSIFSNYLATEALSHDQTWY